MPASKPKIAIVCYSKSGHSRHIAEQLSEVLDADIYALTTARYMIPFFGYLRAGFDSVRRAPTPLTHPLPDIEGYDAAVLCGPVWTSYPAVPLISYMQQANYLPQVIGLLLTSGGHSPPQKAYAMAEQVLGRAFAVQEAIPNSIEDTPDMDDKIARFASDLIAATIKG